MNFINKKMKLFLLLFLVLWVNCHEVETETKNETEVPTSFGSLLYKLAEFCCIIIHIFFHAMNEPFSSKSRKPFKQLDDYSFFVVGFFSIIGVVILSYACIGIHWFLTTPVQKRNERIWNAFGYYKTESGWYYLH
jgi:predicted membrane channel-forming protein YqfA (hemolysin III family)